MKRIKVSKGGQISIPAHVRRRWETSRLTLEDDGDRLTIRPAPDDPVAAARGALAGKAGPTSDALRELARDDERVAEERRLKRR